MSKNIFFLFGTIFLFLGSFVFFYPVKSEIQDIVITEIGAYEQTGYEWVEIYNRGEEPVDLTGWKFWEDGVNHALNIKQGAFVLPGGEFAIIVQDDKKFFEKYPMVTGTVFDSSWSSLNEDGEEIGIKFGTGAEDFVEQFYSLGIDNFSLERVDVNLADYTESNWREHESGNTLGGKNLAFAEEVSPQTEEKILDREDEEGVLKDEEVIFSTSSIPDEGEIFEESTSSIDLVKEEENPSQNEVFEQLEEKNSIGMGEGVSSTGNIVINEFLSDPVEGKEWVELFNTGLSSVNLSLWTLFDGVGMIGKLEGSLDREDFLVVELSSSKLNNTGDKIVLKNQNGEIMDEVAFGIWDDENIADNAPVPNKGHTLARENGEDSNNDKDDFQETTTPTKGEDNNITVPVVVEKFVGPKTKVIYTDKIQEKNSSSAFSSKERFTSGDIVINELLSDPGENQEEFVELYNNTKTDIVLEGWILKDAGGGKTFLEGRIDSKGFFLLTKPKGNLNNSRESLFLFDPSGFLIDQVSYGNLDEKNIQETAPVAFDPMSLARKIDGKDTDHNREDFVVTIKVTPGKPNEVRTPEVVDKITAKKSEKVFLSEIFPNPDGDDSESEFIEIFNPTTNTISLVGWKLQDADSMNYTIQEKKIGPNSFAVFSRKVTHISLNNTGGDKVILFNPLGDIVDEQEYREGVEEEQSYAKVDEQWVWTEQKTPGEKNIFFQSVEEDETLVPKKTTVSPRSQNKKQISKKSTKKSAALKMTTLAGVRDIDKGTRVMVTGTIAVLPGTFGSQYFYIVNDTSGIQIYANKKEFPEFLIGDSVKVIGEVSESYGESRINVKGKEDINFLQKENFPTPQEIEVAAIGESVEGSLIEISGEVTEVKTNSLFLDDGSAEVKVYFKTGTGLGKRDVTLGEKVNIVGIVSQTSGGYQILPRGKEDIVGEKDTQDSSFLKEERFSTSGNKVLSEKIFTGYFASFILIGTVGLVWLLKNGFLKNVLEKMHKIRQVFRAWWFLKKK